MQPLALAAGSSGRQATAAHSPPSPQAESSGRETQAPASQPSWVHAMPSVHGSGVPVHTPSWHTSPVVQASPSSHAGPEAGSLRHWPAWQTSAVQSSPSSQSSSTRQDGQAGSWKAKQPRSGTHLFIVHSSPSAQSASVAHGVWACARVPGRTASGRIRRSSTGRTVGGRVTTRTILGRSQLHHDGGRPMPLHLRGRPLPALRGGPA